ncbi:uncharacterized protein LOC121398219 [Xenopus laevis]|uniref:Uncharacterized protein LOC121398219 n=1 Tax=Xenopus laevis TaxID=8355 RepID=A0A8J1LVG0_XENLA|nr:uncharacterized protein LOC121398219 [Xenopus laevis]
MENLYNFLQCLVYILTPGRKNLRMVYFRMFVCIVTGVVLVAFPTVRITCEILKSCNEHYLKNTLSTLEWIGMLGLLCYMPTYAMELKNLTLKRPKNMKDDWICKREVSTSDEEAPEEPTPEICVHKITLLPSNQIIGLSDPNNIQGTYQLTVLKDFKSKGEESEAGHRLGAVLGFGMENVYNFLQCLVYILTPGRKNLRMVYFRMSVCIVTGVVLVAFPTVRITCEILKSCNEHYLKNTLSTLEWIGMLGLLCYMPTYAMELKNLTLKRPKNMKDDWICKREVSTSDEEAPEEPTPEICVHKITLLPSNQIIGLSDPNNIQGTYQLTVLKDFKSKGEESEAGHRLGAVLGFGMENLYNFLQCLVYILTPGRKNLRMVYFRMSVCIVTGVVLVAFPTVRITCEILKSCNEHYLKNTLSTLEWIGMLGLLCYMPTYAMELKNLTLKRPKNMKDDWICKREVSTSDEEAPEEPTPEICVHKITLLPSNQIIGLSDPNNIQGTYQLTVLKDFKSK